MPLIHVELLNNNLINIVSLCCDIVDPFSTICNALYCEIEARALLTAQRLVEIAYVVTQHNGDNKDRASACYAFSTWSTNATLIK